MSNNVTKLNFNKLKKIIFKPKLPFWRKNDNKGEFSDFYKFTLYMNFANFLKMAFPMMAIYVKNLKNHI